MERWKVKRNGEKRNKNIITPFSSAQVEIPAGSFQEAASSVFSG
jgi:hypothetical protein